MEIGRNGKDKHTSKKNNCMVEWHKGKISVVKINNIEGKGKSRVFK